LLRRGPYVIASGLDESIGGQPYELDGRFVNLFDSELQVQEKISLVPGAREFLVDLDALPDQGPQLIASACRSLLKHRLPHQLTYIVNGVGGTPAVMLLKINEPPHSITLDGQNLEDFNYSSKDKLLWIHFENIAQPQTLSVNF
jgi:hypothetical protein